MKARCGTCNNELPLTARSCPACGMANPSWHATLGTIAAIAVLVPAIAIAIYAATRDQPLIRGDRPADQPLPSQPSASGADNFDWLATAMKACDDKATSEPNALHVLVVPLVASPKDFPMWRQMSLNTIGNAVVLPGSDTLKGLRAATLSIDPGEYAFSVRDEKTKSARKWSDVAGVKWLSIADAGGVETISMQFKPRVKGRDDRWGNAVDHHKGNCYWINAVFED